MAEFHWIGATGSSIEKFNWNNINNWAVKSSSTSQIRRATSFGRLPQGGDTVKIGTDLHCFSPLLYGGYTGGTGHTGQSGLFGNWCQGQTAGSAHGSTGYTAGITGGGIRFILATDVLAASDSSSVMNAMQLRGITNSSELGNPGRVWGGIDTYAANSGQNPETLFFNMLASINPHSAGIAVSNQPVTTAEASRYPFPYLGGGITNDIFRWLKATWLASYAGQTSSNSAEAEIIKNANSWVGGGWTGGDAELIEPVVKGVRVRLGGKDSIGTQSALLITQGLNSETAQNRVFNVDLNCVADKISGSNSIVSDVTLSSRKNPLHSYALRNGTFRSYISTGDAAVLLHSCTAGSVQTDYHNYLSVSPTSRLGGLVVDTDNNDPRYHPWILYFQGGLTASARTTVYGTAVSRISFPWIDKILVNTNPSTYATDNYANGMSGFSWSAMSPMIGIGEFGGTGGPVIDTSGASAVAYSQISAIEVYSNTEPRSTAVSANESAANTNYVVEFLGNSIVGTMVAHGAEIRASKEALPESTVYIGTINMREGASIDFTRNPNLDNWFIGGLTGTGGLTMQMVGGLLFEDDTCIIRPSKGNQFINNKFISNDGVQGIDARASNEIPTQSSLYTNNPFVSALVSPNKTGVFTLNQPATFITFPD